MRLNKICNSHAAHQSIVIAESPAASCKSVPVAAELAGRAAGAALLQCAVLGIDSACSWFSAQIIEFDEIAMLSSLRQICWRFAAAVQSRTV